MDITTANTDLTFKKLVFNETAEHQVESDITLPDYFPDIVRVVKCRLKSNIVSVNNESNHITADGNTVISVLYVCENGKLHCFEQKLPLSKSVDFAKSENSVCVVNGTTQYVNCRVISQRRIDIRASVSLDFKVYVKQTSCVVTSCDDENIQLKSQKCMFSDLKDYTSRCFNINETVEIGASQETIGQIVRSQSVAVIESTKTVAGKILIKGELKTKIVYLSENECGIEKIENTLPISQILEIETSEDSCDFVSLSVCSTEVHAKTDSSGALRLVDIAAVIRADISVYENKEFTYSTDAYSTEFETDYNRENIPVKSVCEKFSDTYLIKGNIQLGVSETKSVEDIFCNSITYTSSFSNGEIVITGKAGVSLLVYNEENELQSFDKEIDFEYRRTSVYEKQAEIQCDILATGIDFLLAGQNKVDIRIETDVNGLIFNYDKIGALSSISCDENKRKKKNCASLTVYFAQQGEEVWDIARKYNTKVDMISSENNLNCEFIDQPRKLYIPSV